MVLAVSTLIPLGLSVFALVESGYYPSSGRGICFATSWYGIFIGYACHAVVLLIVIVCLGMLFWSVRTQELRAAKWSITGTGAASSSRKQKRIFVKSMLYIGAFLIAFVPPAITIFAAPKFTGYVDSVFFPLQGVFNVLIYSDLFGSLKERASSAARLISASFRLKTLKKSRGTTTVPRSIGSGRRKDSVIDCNDDEEDGGSNNVRDP